MNRINNKPRSLLFLVSGPAGSGKTTLCTRMCEEYSEVARIVTATTRPPREGEVDGVDYYFLSVEDFEAKITNNEFCEYAKVHGRFYGTLEKDIHDKLDSGADVLINIDVQGAATLRKHAAKSPELQGRLVTVFVAPTSMDELHRRLQKRAQDDEEEIKRRLKNADMEMGEWHHYDYLIPSGTREEDFDGMRSIFEAEKLRIVNGA